MSCDGYGINDNNVSPKQSPFGYSLVIQADNLLSFSVHLDGIRFHGPLTIVCLHLERLKGIILRKLQVAAHITIIQFKYNKLLE